MKRSLAGLVMCLMLAACGDGAGDKQAALVQAGGASGDVSDVECAIGANAAWSKDCVSDRAGDRLTIRNPDGGFRRFRILTDGRGLEPADGAEIAQVQMVDGNRIEVRIGDDRYRLPVKIAGKAP
ncbi:hypothetical protein [Sphingobium sp.]|uniref:hypothetical protein n=1 Tax=Sphingobium sp. TaxID=1912891 RepID=UPI003BB6D486